MKYWEWIRLSELLDVVGFMAYVAAFICIGASFYGIVINSEKIVSLMLVSAIASTIFGAVVRALAEYIAKLARQGKLGETR